MDDFWFWLRVFNFFWGFVLFCVMIFGFTLDQVVSRHCTHTHVPLEMHLWMGCAFAAVFAVLWGTGEVLLTDIDGGPRILFSVHILILGTLSIKHAMFRVKMHKLAIEHGACR